MRSLSRSIAVVAALMFSFLLVVATCMPEPAELDQATATAAPAAQLPPSATADRGATSAATALLGPTATASAVPSPTRSPVPPDELLPIATAADVDCGALCTPASDRGAEFGVPAGATVVKWFAGLSAGTELRAVQQEYEIVDEYNATNPDNIYIALNIVPNAEAYRILATQIAAGTPPDIIGLVGMRGLSLAVDELLPLDDLIAKHGVDLSAYDEGALRSYRNERGEQIALPYAVFPSFISYNRDLFDAAGLPYPPQEFGALYEGKPWDMAALRELGMRLTLDAQGRNATEPDFDPTKIVQFGFVPQWNDSAISEGAFFGAGDLTGPNDEATFPEVWKEAWRWFYRARHVDHFVPNLTYSSSDEYGRGNVWSTGRVAMAWAHLWYTCCFTPEQVPNWDIAVVPSYNGAYTSKVHPETFAIMRQTENPDAAFKAYMFLLQSEELREIYGGLPGVTAEQPAYFAELDQKFAPNEVSWQVALDSLAYPDVPNHEQAVPNSLEFQDRYVAFDQDRHSDPALDIDAEIAKFEASASAIFQAPPDPDTSLPPLTLVQPLDVPERVEVPGPIRRDDVEAINSQRAEVLEESFINAAFDSVAFSPDGTLLAYETADSMIYLVALESGGSFGVQTDHRGELTALAFSPDGKTLATGGSDHTVRLWNIADWSLVRVLSGHERVITALAFTPDGKTLISGARDGQLRFWEVATGAPTGALAVAEPARIVVSPDGASFIVLVHADGRQVAQLRRMEDGLFLRALGEAPALYGPGALAFAPDGQSVALGTLQGGRVSVVSPTGDELRATRPPIDAYSLAYSPDGAVLAAGTFYKAVDPIMLWDAADGSFLHALSLQGDPAVALAFSPDGSRLAAVSDAGTVRVWRFRS